MVLLALTFGGLPMGVCAQAPNDTVTLHGVSFPGTIGGAERVNVREYEKDHPGLGYSVAYRHDNAVSTVYIYDLQRRDIPGGASSPLIEAEFQAAKADIDRALRQGLYSTIRHKDQFWFVDARDQPRLRCEAAAMTRPDKPNEGATYLCVGGWHRKFIKFRVTGEDLPEASVRPFLQTWVDMLWPR
jgi:hypothetical protein